MLAVCELPGRRGSSSDPGGCPTARSGHTGVAEGFPGSPLCLEGDGSGMGAGWESPAGVSPSTCQLWESWELPLP